VEQRRIFVTDFDGTITERDIYLLIAERYLPAGTPEYFGEYRAGRMSHFEAMRSYLSQGPDEPEAWEELMDAAGADPELGPAIGRLQDAGWEVVIASAGSTWYIERILERAGVKGVALYGNPGSLRAGKGLWIDEPTGARFFSETVGVDKQAIVKDALARAEVVAFAGDGPPDVPSALLVKPELRFARGWLAGELQRRGEPFQEYRVWSEVAARLGSF
jgi:2-hydroxy-3-keto-5-methylthiopentenyl-1-phosphate phosphatase